MMVRHLYHVVDFNKHGMFTSLYKLSFQVQIMGGDCWWEYIKAWYDASLRPLVDCWIAFTLV
jgi:hypothetical protein